MFRLIIQNIKRLLGQSPRPLAVYVDTASGTTVRYELFPRFISRSSLNPRDSDADAGYFMSGLEADAGSIQQSIGITDHERSAKEKSQLDEFLRCAVACVEEFQRAGIPAHAPMATPGINQVFFQKGQALVTEKRIEVFVHVGYFGPFSSGGSGHLPCGAQLRVTQDSEDYTESTSCELLEPYYSDLEKSLVAKDDLANELYAGYSLSINNGILQDHCRLIVGDS